MNQKHCASFERDAFYASQRPNARSLSCSLQDARAFLPNVWLLRDPGNTQQHIIVSSNGKGSESLETQRGRRGRRETFAKQKGLEFDSHPPLDSFFAGVPRNDVVRRPTYPPLAPSAS